MQSTYAAKAAALHKAALRELGGLAEWREPQAGMFMVHWAGAECWLPANRPGRNALRAACGRGLLLRGRGLSCATLPHPPLCSWDAPQWLRLLDVEDATDIEEGLREARVVVVPGRLCHPRGADPAFK
jgi:hypothetical protein